MSLTYDTRRTVSSGSSPSMEALRTGTAAPSQMQLGRSMMTPESTMAPGWSGSSGDVGAPVSGISAMSSAGPIQAAGKGEQKEPLEEYKDLRETLANTLPDSSQSGTREHRKATRRWNKNHAKATRAYLKAFPDRDESWVSRDLGGYRGKRDWLWEEYRPNVANDDYMKSWEETHPYNPNPNLDYLKMWPGFQWHS